MATRMVVNDAATKAMSKKEGVGLQWGIKAKIDGVSGNYPTGFFASLSQITGDDPYKGLQVRCTLSRGNLKSGKTGQYQDNYYWDLVEWNTEAELTSLPPLDQGAWGQSHTPEPAQAPQNKREAGEQMQQSEYPGHQKGWSCNLASAKVHSGAEVYATLAHWWAAV